MLGAGVWCQDQSTVAKWKGQTRPALGVDCDSAAGKVSKGMWGPGDLVSAWNLGLAEPPFFPGCLSVQL